MKWQVVAVALAYAVIQGRNLDGSGSIMSQQGILRVSLCSIFPYICSSCCVENSQLVIFMNF